MATLLPCGILGPERIIHATKYDGYVQGKEMKDLKSGLKMNLNWGNYFNPYTIPAQHDINGKVVDKIEAIRSMTPVPGNVRNVKNYAATVEGYFYVAENGIYEFSTNNNQLWINEEITVDNSHESVPRFSPNNAQLALGKGYHKIKVVFLGGIFGGWPTYWDNGTVRFKKDGGKWQSISAQQLFHK